MIHVQMVRDTGSVFEAAVPRSALTLDALCAQASLSCGGGLALFRLVTGDGPLSTPDALDEAVKAAVRARGSVLRVRVAAVRPPSAARRLRRELAAHAAAASAAAARAASAYAALAGGEGQSPECGGADDDEAVRGAAEAAAEASQRARAALDLLAQAEAAHFSALEEDEKARVRTTADE